jgi:hypothetical protein
LCKVTFGSTRLSVLQEVWEPDDVDQQIEVTFGSTRLRVLQGKIVIDCIRLITRIARDAARGCEEDR